MLDRLSPAPSRPPPLPGLGPRFNGACVLFTGRLCSSFSGDLFDLVIAMMPEVKSHQLGGIN